TSNALAVYNPNTKARFKARPSAYTIIIKNDKLFLLNDGDLSHCYIYDTKKTQLQSHLPVFPFKTYDIQRNLQQSVVYSEV
ncbi:hypothetical protein TrispH2_008899, partial [Trichoplax sp. H2]